MKKKLVLLLTLTVVVFLFTPTAQSATVTFDLCVEFSGAWPPESSTLPWLRATFDDGDTPGSVTLTMEAINLTDAEYVKEWYFNFDPALDAASLVIAWSSGIVADSIQNSNNSFKADGDGYYDIAFDYNLGHDFTDGYVSVYNLNMPGITAGSFDYLSSPSGGHGPFYTAAHVGGIGLTDSDSGWITTPIPGAFWIFGSGLIGLVGLRRRCQMT